MSWYRFLLLQPGSRSDGELKMKNHLKQRVTTKTYSMGKYLKTQRNIVYETIFRFNSGVDYT